MSMRLTLIAHGATAATRAVAFPQDEPVEARALSSAMVSGQRLRRADRAWTSPALRARQTAAALSLEAAVNPCLRDCDYGRWAGRTLAVFKQKSPPMSSSPSWRGISSPANPRVPALHASRLLHQVYISTGGRYRLLRSYRARRATNPVSARSLQHGSLTTTPLMRIA
jgi:hypothetical protein